MSEKALSVTLNDAEDKVAKLETQLKQANLNLSIQHKTLTKTIDDLKR